MYEGNEVLDMSTRSESIRPDRLAHGFRSVFNRGREAFLRSWFDESGVPVLDRNWDTLIILDCCRYDVFADVVKLPGTLTKSRSLASVTRNFVKRNFEGRQAHDVVYMSANPVVGDSIEYLDVFKFVGVWRENPRESCGQENSRGLTDTGPAVERAIHLHAEHPCKRHIIHLLTPHVPHRFKNGQRLPPDSPYRNYEAARNGAVPASVMRGVYTENLKHVINAIRPILDSVYGKIVVTADHGELLGEGMPRWMKLFHSRWGNQWRKYDFGHYSNVGVPELIDVPWFELPGGARREIIPEPPAGNDFDNTNLENHLEALGYR